MLAELQVDCCDPQGTTVQHSLGADFNAIRPSEGHECHAHFSSCLEGRGIFVSSLKNPQTLAGSRPARGPSTAPIFCLLLGLSVSARIAEADISCNEKPDLLSDGAEQVLFSVVGGASLKPLRAESVYSM